MKETQEFEYEYDPIKEMKGGKEAERVIWSTVSLMKAVEGLKMGLPLKANPFIGKNTKLLKPDLVYKRTKEEIDDYIKCKCDPVYFASKCYLKTPKGVVPCVMRDYQIDYLRHLQNNNFSIFLSCRQSGKSTTTAIYCLWVILFNTDKIGLILSKSGPAGIDLLKKIKDMFLFLPYHLKVGTLKWNQSEISFDNNSSISTEAFSPTAGLGKTINFLILDEFAWCPPNDVELFYNNIIPVITTDTNANVCIMSTQNGFNLFYKLWKASIEKKSIYAPFKVDWNQVPDYDKIHDCWIKRDEAWKKKMVGILGSEEAFYYQYGTQFSASDKCLVSRECLSVIRDETILYEYNDDTLDITLLHKDKLCWDPEYDLERLKTCFYLILVDLAEGGGGDYTVFHILEITGPNKFKQVGYWRANDVKFENAALDFWLLVAQLFNNDRCLISIEWNTYGALFYKIIMGLNEPDADDESNWRMKYAPEGIDNSNIVKYEIKSIDENVIGKKSKSQYRPGIKFTSSSKPIACTLLKMMIENKELMINDLVTCGELENFEDKNGSGTYKASYGHDDLIMTLVQLPMLKQTLRYSEFIEDMVFAEIDKKMTTSLYGEEIDDGTSIYSIMQLPEQNTTKDNNNIYDF